MKRLALIPVIVMLLSFVNSLEVIPDKTHATLIYENPAPVVVELTIKNATAGNYNVYTLADVTIEPGRIFQLGDGTFKKNFTFAPNNNLDFVGNYLFTYTLNHRGVEKVDNKFLFSIVELKNALKISATTPKPLEGEVSLRIENKVPARIENLKARFKSEVFDKTLVLNIGPLETKTITIKADAEKIRKTKAGVYVIESTFFTKRGEVRLEGNLYLGEKRGITSSEDFSGFLITTHTKTKINSGNTVEDVEISLDKNIISRIFTVFNREPNEVNREGFKVTYVWKKQELRPGEVFIVKAKTNYLLPFLILIAIVLMILGFRRFREVKVEVKKSVVPLKAKKGEFALKIKLNVKARKDVENLSVIDKIPKIVKVYKKFGTLKPDKIDTASRRVHWNLGNLSSGEERVIDYIVYSRVGIVGKFSLPPALCVFEREGEVHEVESNRVFFMSEES